jgi:hypothetical protein
VLCEVTCVCSRTFRSQVAQAHARPGCAGSPAADESAAVSAAAAPLLAGMIFAGAARVEVVEEVRNAVCALFADTPAETEDRVPRTAGELRELRWPLVTPQGPLKVEVGLAVMACTGGGLPGPGDAAELPGSIPAIMRGQETCALPSCTGFCRHNLIARAD